MPVVSWQNIQDRDERLLYIRDGRRAFHPVIPPPPPPSASQMLLYQQQPYSVGFQSPNSASAYQHSKPLLQSNQRQTFRGRSKISVSTNNMPFIPKFPACFNNNNPLVMNNNFYEKKSTDVVNSRQQRGNGRSRGIGRGSYRTSSPPPNPSNSSPPQIMQYERSIMMTNPPPRWCNNSPQVTTHQIKRLIGNKRQNGSIPNMVGQDSFTLKNLPMILVFLSLIETKYIVLLRSVQILEVSNSLESNIQFEADSSFLKNSRTRIFVANSLPTQIIHLVGRTQNLKK